MKTLESKKKSLIVYIEVIFLFAFMFLTFVNTFVLCLLVPVVGYNLMPDNQVASESWARVSVAMVGCVGIIILCVVAYVTVMLLCKHNKKRSGTKRREK